VKEGATIISIITTTALQFYEAARGTQFCDPHDSLQLAAFGMPPAGPPLQICK